MTYNFLSSVVLNINALIHNKKTTQLFHWMVFYYNGTFIVLLAVQLEWQLMQ